MNGRLLGRGLSLVAGLLVAGLLVAAVGLSLGWRVLYTESHSMQPDVPSGSILVTRPAAASHLRHDDLVSIRLIDGTRLTRRVDSVHHRGAGATIVVSADATNISDPNPYAVSDTDLIVFHAPVIGRVVDDAISLPGLLVLFLLVLVANMRRRSRSGARAHPTGVRSLGA